MGSRVMIPLQLTRAAYLTDIIPSNCIRSVIFWIRFSSFLQSFSRLQDRNYTELYTTTKRTLVEIRLALPRASSRSLGSSCSYASQPIGAPAIYVCTRVFAIAPMHQSYVCGRRYSGEYSFRVSNTRATHLNSIHKKSVISSGTNAVYEQ